MALPSTLQEAIIYFAEPKKCNEFLAGLRWTDGKPRCPHCGSDNVTYLATQNRYKCYGKHPKAQFSLKVGTTFEDSPISLDKWLCAMWLIVNCKNGISSCEMAKDLGITQKSAWFLDHRIRFALYSGSFEKLSGHVEADETFIGGKARNMHVAQRQRRITGTGTKDKAPVMGILERGKDGKSRIPHFGNSEPKENRDPGRSQKARGSRFRALQRCASVLPGTCWRICSSGRRSCCGVRRRGRTHERVRELLEFAQTVHLGNIR
jgi:transposase-like protein